MRGRAGDCSRVTSGQMRPHLCLCLGPNVPLQGRQGSRGCILDSPRSQASSRGETKDFSLFSSRDGYFLEPTEWTKGNQASSGVWREDSGLHSRTCRKRRPSSHDDGGGSRWFYRAAAPVLVSQEVRRGAQGASCVAPGKLGLDACGEGERVIALESW